MSKQDDEVSKVINSMAPIVSGMMLGKGRAAERLEALAEVAKGLDLSNSDIKRIKVGWEVLEEGEFLPTLDIEIK